MDQAAEAITEGWDTVQGLHLSAIIGKLSARRAKRRQFGPAYPGTEQ